jgi:hypothetical protein
VWPSFPDRSTDLRPGPTGQGALDEVVLLDERPALTVGIRTPPSPLAPQQPDGAAPVGKVPDLDRTPSMADGPHAAARTTGDRRRGFDEQPPLAVDPVHDQDHEPVHPQQRRRVAITVSHVPSLPFSLVSQPQESGATGPYWWMPMGGSPNDRCPRRNAKSHISKSLRWGKVSSLVY